MFCQPSARVEFSLSPYSHFVPSSLALVEKSGHHYIHIVWPLSLRAGLGCARQLLASPGYVISGATAIGQRRMHPAFRVGSGPQTKTARAALFFILFL